ncbi:MAG: AAA family ATPase, partial [Myxococcales bacterium]|nr:AAA family ATPase [Myxococcales bacterium]
MIGRANELAQLQAWSEEDSRAVVVVGPPGVGKTRLLQEFCDRRSELGPANPLLWLDLSHCSTSEELLLQVASALDLDSSGASDPGPEQSITRELRNRGPLFLVLDHVEHVADACRELGTGWLHASADLRLLIGCRNRLWLAGEQVLHLDPLSLPLNGRPTAESDAVQMLLECASRVYQTSLEDEDSHAILAAISVALDGIPLAIEMAAARLAILSPEQLLERLDNSLDLLKRRRSDDRHGSLRRCIEMSWELMDDEERQTLQQTAVFPAAFDIESAEAILHVPEVDLLDALQGLWERSLLQAETDAARFRRFRLLRSVRELATEKWPQGVISEEVCGRFVAYWASKCFERVLERPVEGSEQGQDLIGDYANIKEAFDLVQARPSLGGPEIQVKLA